MHWVAPSEKDQATDTLEKRLWASADQLRANFSLKSQECAPPVLGLSFQRFVPELMWQALRCKSETRSAQ